MIKPQEEVLFKAISVSWERDMPVTLITHAEGLYSLHCQTGDHHKAALKKADEILQQRGLLLGEACFVGPSGMYYRVIELPM